MSEAACVYLRSEGSRIGWREELNCDIVIARASADPTGSDGAEMALQICPSLRKGLSPYTSLPTVSSRWMQTTPGRGKAVGEAAHLWLKLPQRTTNIH